MKNISQKTLIFYTFQNNRDKQYNVTALKNDIKEPKIKDVITQLPVDLAGSRYHFRFKSEFFESNEKTIGWIDIVNLNAKVPIYSGAIYVKVLKFGPGEDERSKIFTKEKLAKAEIIEHKSSKQEIKVKPKQIPKSKPETSIALKTNHENLLSQQHAISYKTEVKSIQQTSSSNKNSIDLTEHILGPMEYKIPQQTIISKTQMQKQAKEIPTQSVPYDSPQEKLKRFQEQFRQQQQDKDNERIARDQLQDKIRAWGYSGHKIVNNLNTLLATLHEMWPQWKPVSLGDMLTQSDVRKIYKKAVIIVAPDKNRQKDFRTRYLAKGIFEILNEAKLKK